ncbi:MAG: M14 family metallocarboxypeptidase [Verrucomicrobia bacterium]|nr:M14 family metallocarboxypeptidase [Verrucomicrobiota bacterium]
MNSPAPVKTSSPIDPPALMARFAAAARPAGFRVEPFGECAGTPLFALTKRTPGPRPRIYLSAGIHGDEPAPPLALLELLEAGVFDDRAVWFLCPLLNPAGFHRATRENADGLDLNRDYKALRSAEIRAHSAWLARQPNFDLTLCVHEDWESTGFYLYELNPTGRSTLADAMIAAAARVCPIEPATVIDGRPIDAPGIIRPVADPSLRDLWPEAIYLRAHHTTLSYTLESPSALPLPQRLAVLRAAIGAAISHLQPSVR